MHLSFYNKFFTTLLVIPFFLSLSTISFSQTLIPASTIVTQNFNSIGVSPTTPLPANWKMSSAGTGATANWATGTNITATTQAANTGTPVAGGAYNWATTAGSDRAIGFMTDGGYTSPNSIMAFYRNTTGAPVTTITARFSVERYGVNSSPFALSFFSSTDGTAWTARTSGDISSAGFTTGASAYTFNSPQTIFRIVTITGLSIPNNGDFYLRWLLTTGAANSQGLGLDDVMLFAGAPTPVVLATMQDALTIDNPPVNQANPGDQLTYTTKIKNIGTGDANNVNLTAPAPANTTLVGGSITTSALARDDNYLTAVNTALTGSNILTNDFGLPSLTVASFGPVSNAATTAAGGTGNSDNGGTVVVNSDGTFTYTPPTGFAGTDKFSYIAATGTLPNNDAVVTITVGAAASSVTDNYTVTGNVSISHAAGAGVLSNDIGSSIAVTSVNGNAANVGNATATTQSGSVTLNTDGSFNYNPPAGYEGTDNFTYTIDNGFGVPSTTTVNLTVSGMIWFINNAAGSAGDGRLSSPFNTLAGFTSINNGTGNNPAANDNIFIYTGAGNYTGGTVLLNNQRLFGQGASVSLVSAAGITLAPGSAALPTTGGTNPTIINAAGNGIAVAQGNTIRGLSIGNCSGNALSGTTFGTLTVSETGINTTGQAIALATGTLNATFTSVSSSGGVSGILFSGVAGSTTISAGTITGNSGASVSIVGGTTTLTYSGGITQINNASMINVSGGHTTGTITFNTGTLNATNGTGLQFDNADGTYNFNGTTTLNGGDAGIDILNGSGGTFTFASGTSITNPSGIAFNIGGTANTVAVTYNGSISKNSANATVNITNHATGIVTFQTGTITATNGTGLQFDNADATYNFSGVVTLNGGDAGIDIINGSAGNFTFTNAPITNPTGAAFLVNGGAGSIGHTGTISKTSAGRLVDIQARTGGSVTITGNLSSTVSCTGINASSNTGGTITFSGTTKTMNTPAITPVTLATNTGATINFTSGGLAITSTTATGFNATGGGTISIQGTANAITSTSGTALNVANTTIGASGLTFQSISSNGSANGIILNTTGSSGGLTITGTGAAGSGGTIQNTTSHSISLTSTTSPSFNNLTIQNSAGSGVKGTTIINFSFTNSTIDNSGTGGGLNESNIAFNTTVTGTESNVSGNVTITGNTLTNSRYHGIDILNFSGTISLISLSNNTLTSSTVAANSLGSGIRFQTLGSATTASSIIKANVDNNIVTNWPNGSGILVQGGNGNAAGPVCTLGIPNDAVNIITITGNRITGQSSPNQMGSNGIVAAVSGKGQGNFNISSNGTIANPIINVKGSGIAFSVFGPSTATGTISNNVIVANNIVASRAISCGVDRLFGASDAPDLTVTISNNNISQSDGNGIFAGALNSNGIFKGKILNNVVAAPLTGNRYGIQVNSGTPAAAGTNTTVCLTISGNTSAGSGVATGIGLRKEGVVSNVNTFGIQGMAATSSPGVETYVNGQNPLGGTTTLVSGTGGFVSCVNN